MTVKAPPRPHAKPATGGPKPDIDPRIRARRIEVQRTEGRKRLRRAGVLAVALAVLAGSWWITVSPALDVDHVRVHGATRTGDDAVLAAIDIRHGDALLTADVGAAARSLARLPWVATANVRRAWPGSISVEVVERVPTAAIAAKGSGWVLVDRGGRQLAVEDAPALELVRIAGRPIAPSLGDAAGERYQGALDLAAVTPPTIRPAITALWPQRDGTIEASVQLPSGAATVRFGAPDQLEAKLVALVAVLERADVANVRIIDLRVPGAPALTRG